MIPMFVQSFLAYSLIEYVTIMGLVDNGIRILFFRPEMSQEARMKLLGLEVVIIAILAVILLLTLQHFPVCSIMMIWYCLYSTKDAWLHHVWRYWNDFTEFERFKPKQLFVHQIQTIPTSPGPDVLLKNGGILDDPNSPAAHHLPLPLPPRDAAYIAPPARGIQWQPFFQSLLPNLHRQRGHPPGLVNNTRKNLCSINVVLQALAGLPQLIDGLNRDKPRLKNTENLKEFVNELVNVLSNLRKGNVVTVSTQCLLEYADSLNPPQPQTDCVEWLMWLLEVVHNGFVPPGNTELEINIQKLKLLRAVPLAQPLLVLYKPSQVPQALATIKAECLEKIQRAHGLQVVSYADPIQRLTEVEWLSHKLTNHSVIDDMFTGQMVETQHCKVCHHLSVTVQPFRVLPIPIPASQKHSTNHFSLQYCLEHFASVEKLYGSNGLHCKHCNSQHSGYGYFSDAKIRVPIPSKNTLITSNASSFNKSPYPNIGILSPIQPFPDGRPMPVSPELLRSSTPIRKQSSLQHTHGHGSVVSPIFSSPQAASSPVGVHYHLTDGERQALISQLPDFLIIQLLRLTYWEGQPVKVSTSISIPVSNLDLSNLCTEHHLGGDHKSSLNGYYKYNLYAIVLHLGESSVTHGHYLIYAQTGSGSWFCFDDEKVTPVNIEYQLQTKRVRENACLLYYRKVEVIC